MYKFINDVIVNHCLFSYIYGPTRKRKFLPLLQNKNQ